MATIDIRTGGATNITEIQFADDFSLVGAVGDNVIQVRRISDGQTRPIAVKADIPNLILALEAAKKIW